MLKNMELSVQRIRATMEIEGFKLTKQDLQELRFDVMALQNPEDMINSYIQNKGLETTEPTHYTFDDFR